MHAEHKMRNIALLVLATGIVMFALVLIFVLPYFMSEKKYGEMQAALNEGDYYKVFKTAEFLLNQNPDSVQAYYFRGQAYLALKKYSYAEFDLEKVIELNAQYANMRSVGVQLGEIYHKHGLTLMTSQPDKAYRLFLKAQKHLPREINIKRDTAVASYYIGQAFENSDKNKAILYYREAVKYNPDKALYKLVLGRNLLDIAKSEEAVDLITQAFKFDPTLKNNINVALLKDALWRLAIAKERDYYQGKITDAQPVTKLLDNILSIDSVAKEALLERFAFAVNTNNIEDAKRILKIIRDKAIPVSTEDLEQLLVGMTQPQILFSGGNETDVELKLDSELAWSSDGKKIVVKAMDKTTSQTKILLYNFDDATSSLVNSSEKVVWEGKVFAPIADGMLISSEETLYRIEEKELTLKKVGAFAGALHDVTRDGLGALVSKGKNLYRYDFSSGRRSSIRISKLSGDISRAAFSPWNKRVAVASGDAEAKKLGVYFGKGKSRILSEGNIDTIKWSFDGEKVYYGVNQSGINSMFVTSVDGSIQDKPLTKPEMNVSSFEPSPVDNLTLYKGLIGKDALWLIDDAGYYRPAVPRYGQFGKFVWSPDGEQAAYLFSPVTGGPVRLEVINIKR